MLAATTRLRLGMNFTMIRYQVGRCTHTTLRISREASPLVWTIWTVLYIVHTISSHNITSACDDDSVQKRSRQPVYEMYCYIRTWRVLNVNSKTRVRLLCTCRPLACRVIRFPVNLYIHDVRDVSPRLVLVRACKYTSTESAIDWKVKKMFTFVNTICMSIHKKNLDKIKTNKSYNWWNHHRVIRFFLSKSFDEKSLIYGWISNVVKIWTVILFRRQTLIKN